MTCLRAVLGIVLLLLSANILAQRIIPSDMRVAVLDSARGREVVLRKATWGMVQTLTFNLLGSDKQTFPLNASVRVRSEKNLLEPYGRLTRYSGKAVAVRFDNQNRVNEIWILTDEERAKLNRRANGQDKLIPY